MFKHILVPLDGSSLAETALPFASRMCSSLGSAATLLHVIEKNAPQQIHGERHLTNEQEACDYLDERREQYFAHIPQVECHVHTEEVSDVARSIVQHAGELAPDLIILCAHGSGGFRDLVIGSIAQQVISLGKVPVLMLQPGEEMKPSGEIKKILAPVDGQPHHQGGLETAAQLALSLAAELNLLMVVQTSGSLSGHEAATGMLLPSATRVMLEAAEEYACKYLEARAQPWRAKGASIETAVRRGDPVQQIIKTAGQVKPDLLVLSTHGKAGMGAFWAGSTGSKIINATRIPLLLVPAPRQE